MNTSYPLIRLLLVLFAVSFLASCSKSPAEDKELSEVINRNIEMLQKEDVEGYMKTIDPKSSVYEGTKEILPRLFADFDISYEIKEIAVLEKTDSSASVQVSQVTKKIKGGDFRDNEGVMIHTLVKRNGEWKISDSQIKDIKYLD